MTQTPTMLVPLAIYTVEEAAAVLRVSEARVRNLVAAGHLRPLRYTAKYRFWGEDLITYCRTMGAGEAVPR